MLCKAYKKGCDKHMIFNTLIDCPHCGSCKLLAKHTTSFTYSYRLSQRESGHIDHLSFEFDNRERGDSVQFLECENCGATIPCEFHLDPDDFHFTITQKAIRSSHTSKPEFLG